MNETKKRGRTKTYVLQKLIIEPTPTRFWQNCDCDVQTPVNKRKTARKFA